LKGHLEGMLLAVLDENPLHGYAVLEALRTDSAGSIDLPSGTVYPALHRLETAGLVTSSWAAVGGRQRRIYRLTPAGKRALGEHRRSWTELASVVSRVMGIGSDMRQAPAG
jgi:DNA-binding PadR family transcriptional regulator